MWQLCIQRSKGQEFIAEFRPFLPADAESRIIPPVHVPGDSARFSLPIQECSEPEKALEILTKYFPDLIEKATIFEQKETEKK